MDINHSALHFNYSVIGDANHTITRRISFPKVDLSTEEAQDSKKKMARGNQRDLARAKNLKKQEASKGQKQGDKTKRMESDADKMRAKQAAADAKKAEEAQQPKK
ncbi:hypothetical protein DFJ63DRAFT_334094 [Scheffersomyces coipomensis]|uniref:uncharacterized protein n=1 Tax=Scheffersomyces coipomensis TaxID=1788519 RepID=UPI00315DD010